MLANSATTTRRLVALLAFFALTFGLLAGPLALIAHADGNASAFVVEANLAKDGTLKVKQTITFTGAVPPELSQKFETRENLVGDRQYVQTLSEITASVKGAAVTPTVKSDDRFTTVTVATNGATEVMMGYTVTGAVVTIEGGETALRWGLLQGLSAQVAEFAATVQIPTQFTYIKCTAGAPNSDVPCDVATAGTEGSQIPTFRDGPRGEGEVVAVDIGFPANTVASNEQIDYRWTVGRAFSAEPLQLALALGLLALGARAVCSCCTGAQASMRGRAIGSPGPAVRPHRRRPDRVPGRRRRTPRPCRHRGRRAGRPDRRDGDPGRSCRARAPVDHRTSSRGRVRPGRLDADPHRCPGR